jgi:hypothetical protein
VAKNRFGSEKRQRELNKERKREEKRQRKLDRKSIQESPEAPATSELDEIPEPEHPQG